jgi:hypothetical protein
MIHTCSRHFVVKPGGKECTKYLVNEKTTDLHPQNLQKGQVAQSYKPYLAHLRLHFNYNISTKHPVFIDHTKLNPDKGVTTELIVSFSCIAKSKIKGKGDIPGELHRLQHTDKKLESDLPVHT